MKARKYHVFGLGAVTAYDSRDVEPLLAALREIGNVEKAQDADALEWAMWAHDLAHETLEAFEPFTQQDGGEQ